MRSIFFKSLTSGRFAMIESRDGVEIDRKIISKDAGFRIMGQLIEEGFREVDQTGRNSYRYERA